MSKDSNSLLFIQVFQVFFLHVEKLCYIYMYTDIDIF